jgi:hypothetical protein
MNNMGKEIIGHPGDVVCSLFEGDYHLGAAVLVNSLLRVGFKGRFRFGYRGGLPPWCNQLEKISEDGEFLLNNETLIKFERLEVECHLTNYKPQYCRTIFETDSTAQRLFYFDPDIVTGSVWNFYQQWADLGVALCEEIVNGTMPSDHPIRRMWIEFMRKRGKDEPRRQISRYYNGGFVGLTRQRKGFLDLWLHILNEAAADGLKLDRFMDGNRSLPFFASDQDALNVTCMYTEEELATIGPEGMGFTGGGFTMDHANQGIKPWRKSFLLEALSGRPPLPVDRYYLMHAAGGPIHPLGAWDLRWRRITCQIALGIGRFYRKP